ncbi:MAG: site-2 protease family protein [Clostridia bacterium]|nr:site-2 protease family protein [Clostridia bacterium]
MISSLFSVAVTIFIFGLLIFIHEFGHYIVARAFGVGVIEFAIGMGPTIKTWKGKYNDFSIRAIPIGGFVNMVGEYDEDIPEEHKNKISINERAVWKRMLIVVMGPLMNILLAFLVMLGLVLSSPLVGTSIVAEFDENSVSDDYGLRVYDEIIEVNGKKIHCHTDMSYKILSDGDQPIDIVVNRNGEIITLEGVNFGVATEEGVAFGTMDFKVFGVEKTFKNVMKETFWQSASTVYITLDSLVDTFSGRYGSVGDAVGGPVAVGSEVDQTIKASASFKETVQNLSMLVVMISVSLGVFNLLPIPVLDGGRLLFYIIEAIRGKPMDPKYERAVSAFFMTLLLALTALVMLKDIMNLF